MKLNGKMKPNKKINANDDLKPNARMVAVAIIGALFLVSFLQGVSAQETVELETADPFAILAGQTVTNTGASVITGDIGLHPGTSVTGFEDATVDGDFHINNETARIAKADLLIAYNDAFARPINDTLSAELGNSELLPGVYASETGKFEITGNLTLNAQGDPDAVWIFKMESTLITAVDSSVLLINEAQACNVFWQVGSSATINDGSDHKGNILAQTSISMKGGATLDGRALALDGSVTLINNVISIAECAPEDDPTGDDPEGDDPEGDDPTGDDPEGDDPEGDDPTGDDPAGDDPTGDEPSEVCSTELTAVANQDTSIELTWQPIEGAQMIRIYRATGDGALVLHGEVDGDATSFIDTDTEAGDTNRYEVRPVIDGVESEDCKVVEVTVIPFFPGLLAGALALVGGVAAYSLSRRRK